MAALALPDPLDLVIEAIDQVVRHGARQDDEAVADPCLEQVPLGRRDPAERVFPDDDIEGIREVRPQPAEPATGIFEGVRRIFPFRTRAVRTLL